MNNKDKYFCEPPQGHDFSALFHYLWNHGVGNNMSENGLPNPWTEDSFESALQSIRRDVSLRSIQNWRSGKTRPSRKNIHAIAKVVSGDNRALQKQWSESLLLALRAETKIPEPTRPQADLNSHNMSSKPVSENRQSRKLWILVLAGMFIAGSGWAYNFLTTKPNSSPAVTISDIRFCGETDFSHTTKRCLKGSARFPASIDIVYVSFETGEVPYGHPFERWWYHNGVKFIQRDGFFDEAWENYTWVKRDELKGAGKYVMRVIVDGRVTTGSFHLTEE